MLSQGRQSWGLVDATSPDFGLPGGSHGWGPPGGSWTVSEFTISYCAPKVCWRIVHFVKTEKIAKNVDDKRIFCNFLESMTKNGYFCLANANFFLAIQNFWDEMHTCGDRIHDPPNLEPDCRRCALRPSSVGLHN